jgi:hypothetical protein
MTPYGRREAWEDNPEGWPEAPQADSPVGGHGSPICWYWRSDADGNATWGPTSRPVPQWTRPGATPVETLGRHGHHQGRPRGQLVGQGAQEQAHVGDHAGGLGRAAVGELGHGGGVDVHADQRDRGRRRLPVAIEWSIDATIRA